MLFSWLLNRVKGSLVLPRSYRAAVASHPIAGRTWAWVGTVHLPRYANGRLVVATTWPGGLDYRIPAKG